jgi:hypothetical protein
MATRTSTVLALPLLGLITGASLPAHAGAIVEGSTLLDLFTDTGLSLPKNRSRILS